MGFGYELKGTNTVKIKVIGVGGGGNNAINTMIKNEVNGVEYIAINTDTQALDDSSADRKIQISVTGDAPEEKRPETGGVSIRAGHGAGAKPEIGKMAAEACEDEIRDAIKDADLIFIAAGMGGGTGTGASPVVARIATELKILTVAVVTKPFGWEKRGDKAIEGILELKKHVDSLLVIPNDKVKYVSEEKMSITNGFQLVDSVLMKAVVSIADIIQKPAFINVDLADVTTVMAKAGMAHMGVGMGKSPVEAAKNAVESKLLETSIEGAEKLIVQFKVTSDEDFDAVDEAAELISSFAKDKCELIFGIDSRDDINTTQVIVIATGIPDKDENQEDEVNQTQEVSQNSLGNSLQTKKQQPADNETDAVDREWNSLQNIFK